MDSEKTSQERAEDLVHAAYFEDQAYTPPDATLMEEIQENLKHLPYEDLVAVNLVLTERVGQLTREGWTLNHDDRSPFGDMSYAAAAFAKAAADELRGGEVRCPSFWPWSKKWWKPYGFQRNLERSAALLIAEISKMLRSPED